MELELMLAGDLLFFLLVVWQRKTLSLAVAKIMNGKMGALVTIRHKDRTTSHYSVKDVKNFSPKKNFFTKLSDPMPSGIDVNVIPNTPFSRDRATNCAEYEFDEESNECLDPYNRVKENQNKIINSQQLVEHLQLGIMIGRNEGKSKINLIILLLLVGNLILGVFTLKTLSDQAEAMKPFIQKVGDVVDRINGVIDSNQFSTLQTGGNSVGRVN